MNLPESLKKILSEQDQQEIKAEFDKQVEIAKEAALHQYDDIAIEKTKQLVNQINECHSTRLKNLMTKRENKERLIYENLEKRYKNALKKEAKDFKTQLVNGIQQLIESSISKVVPFSTIKKAARNNTALIVLEGLRKQLGVDSALMKECIAEPIMDAKHQLETARNQIKKLKAKNKQLNESLNTSESNLLIESKIANLAEDTASYMRRMLQGHDTRYINEQFNYILGLYKDNKIKKQNILKEEALNNRQRKTQITEPKHINDLIPESNHYMSSEDNLIDEILNEMNNPF